QLAATVGRVGEGVVQHGPGPVRDGRVAEDGPLDEVGPGDIHVDAQLVRVVAEREPELAVLPAVAADIGPPTGEAVEAGEREQHVAAAPGEGGGRRVVVGHRLGPFASISLYK